MSQKSRETERRVKVDAVAAERARCALWVRAGVGMLRNGVGHPWDELDQALVHIERGDTPTAVTHQLACSAHQAEESERKRIQKRFISFAERATEAEHE